MPFIIRKTLSSDLSSVIDLIREFAAFEELSAFCEITVEKLEAVTSGPDAFVECIVAFDDENLAGYAMIYPSFASFRGQKGMYVEDIFIRAEYRGTGLGQAMLKEISRIAHSRGCERIDFLVLDWNTSAIGFYEKHGAVRDEQERHFKFVGEAFDKLAS